MIMEIWGITPAHERERERWELAFIIAQQYIYVYVCVVHVVDITKQSSTNLARIQHASSTYQRRPHFSERHPRTPPGSPRPLGSYVVHTRRTHASAARKRQKLYNILQYHTLALVCSARLHTSLINTHTHTHTSLSPPLTWLLRSHSIRSQGRALAWPCP
jgi:hypothetical protein